MDGDRMERRQVQDENNDESSGEFKPLDFMRGVRDDESLTAQQKSVLNAMALRTNKGSRRLVASLGMLANDASVKRETVSKAIKSTEVLRYVESVRPVENRRYAITVRPIPGSEATTNVEWHGRTGAALSADAGKGDGAILWQGSASVTKTERAIEKVTTTTLPHAAAASGREFYAGEDDESKRRASGQHSSAMHKQLEEWDNKHTPRDVWALRGEWPGVPDLHNGSEFVVFAVDELRALASRDDKGNLYVPRQGAVVIEDGRLAVKQVLKGGDPIDLGRLPEMLTPELRDMFPIDGDLMAKVLEGLG